MEGVGQTRAAVPKKLVEPFGEGNGTRWCRDIEGGGEADRRYE